MAINTATAQESRAHYRILFRQAMLDMDRQHYDQAIEKLLKVLASNADNSNAAYLLGTCYLYGESSPAKAAFQLVKASRNISEDYQEWNLDETNAPTESLYHLAKAYEKMDRYDLAAEKYELLLDRLSLDRGFSKSKTYTLTKKNANECDVATERSDPKVIQNLVQTERY